MTRTCWRPRILSAVRVTYDEETDTVATHGFGTTNAERIAISSHGIPLRYADEIETGLVLYRVLTDATLFYYVCKID